MGTDFFFSQYKNNRKLYEDTCIFICTHLNSIMGLFRANNTVANFWMLFAMLSAYGVVASEVGPEVGREALAHVACEQVFLESAIVAFWLFFHQKQSSASLISQESSNLPRRSLLPQSHLHLTILRVLQGLISCFRMEPLLKST